MLASHRSSLPERQTSPCPSGTLDRPRPLDKPFGKRVKQPSPKEIKEQQNTAPFLTLFVDTDTVPFK